MEVSRGSQHRLIHRQTFELPIEQDETHRVEEISIDGGKARIRTPLGQQFQIRNVYFAQTEV